MNFTESQEETIKVLESVRNRIARQQSDWLQSVEIINKEIKKVKGYTEEIMDKAHRVIKYLNQE